MAEKKLFLQIQVNNIVHANVVNIIVMLITKRMEIVMSIHVYVISWMNFDYTKNGAKKALFPNPKHQCHVSQ